MEKQEKNSRNIRIIPYVVVGALLGATIGYILTLAYPSIVVAFLKFDLWYSQQVGPQPPVGYSVKSGSPLASVVWTLSIFLGLLGALFGWIIGILVRRVRNKNVSEEAKHV